MAEATTTTAPPIEDRREPPAASRARWFAPGVGAVFAGAFALRVYSLDNVGKRNPDGGDPLYYHVQANLVASGKGFSEPFTWIGQGRLIPTALHPPLFTLWLSIASKLGWHSFYAHKVMACLAGALACAVIALVGREVAGNRAGLIAGAVAAVYPNLWIIDGTLWPEGLFALTIAGTMLAAYRWRRHPRLLGTALVGAIIALAALTRGEALFLLPALVAPMVLGCPGLSTKQRLTHLAVAGAACLAVLAPWTIRNVARFDGVVPLSTNSNEVIYYANCPGAYDGPTMGFWVFACQERYRQRFGDPPGDENTRSRFWRDRGVDYASAHKGRLPIVFAARVGRVWDVWRPRQNLTLQRIDGRKPWASKLGQRVWFLVLAGGLLGLVVLRRRQVWLTPLVAQLLMVTATAIYAYGTVRFRVAGEVALIVLAGVAVDAVLRKLPSFIGRKPA